MKRFIKEYVPTILITLTVVLLRLYVFPVYQVDGQSMDYTLAHGEKILATNVFDIERFDVVVIDVPEENKLYIKRVIGLPGETIEFKNDILYVNDEPIDEPFLEEKKHEYNDKFTQDISKVTIPEGTYYCLGDNRRNSTDSRKLGPFERERILSEALYVFWPLDKISNLNHMD